MRWFRFWAFLGVAHPQDRHDADYYLPPHGGWQLLGSVRGFRWLTSQGIEMRAIGGRLWMRPIL